MRHRIAGRKLSLPNDQRMALLHGLVRALIMAEAIETTEPRAKEARIIAERLITLAKVDSVHNRRNARKIFPALKMPKEVLNTHGKAQKQLRDQIIANDTVKRLFEVIAPKFVDRNGGYTRITKIGFRRGDAAPIVKLEFVVD